MANGTFNAETLKEPKVLALAAATTLIILLAVLLLLTMCIRRRRKRLDAEADKIKKAPGRSAGLRQGYDSTSSSPRATRPRSHSWRTPPQTRRDLPVGPPIAGGLMKTTRSLSTAPIFSPDQYENILQNYNMSLPSYRGGLESIEDEGSRSEDDEAPSCYEGPGKVSLRLTHNEDLLSVHIINCKGLPANCRWTARGPQFFRRNPFVRITLLPDTGAAEETVSTKERHKTLNPNFDETFQLPVGTHELQDRAIRISVFDKEEGKNPKMIGTVIHPLDRVATVADLRAASKDESDVIVLDLARHEGLSKDEPESMQRRGSCLGEISIGLTCNPPVGTVRVNVLKMKGLRSLRDIRVAEAYLRLQLHHGEQLLNTKSTNVFRLPRDSTTEVPIFESFNFKIPGKFFYSVAVMITVVAARTPQDCPSNRDLVLGNIILGPEMFARGEALSHWDEMMAAPGAMVTKWHQLEDPSGFRSKIPTHRARSRSMEH